MYSQELVTGKVLQENGTAIPFANILILSTSDSSLVKGAISDLEGNFSIEIPHDDNLSLQVKYLGFDNYNTQLLINNSKMGNIILTENTLALDEVTVTSQKPLYEQKLDRTVVNVQSSVTNAGSTVLNVLSKSPNVNINVASGQINLAGKEGVLIMINNKMVRMEPADIINMLANMPAENVKNIELITTPPAKFDSQGSAGIININTTTSDNLGTTGRAAMNFAYGKTPKYGASINLNSNYNKLQTRANISANVSNEDVRIDIITDYQYDNNAVWSEMNSLRDTRTGLYIAELGFDYEVSKHTTIGMMGNYYLRDWDMDAISNSEYISENDGAESEFINSTEKNDMYRFMWNINLSHQFINDALLSIDYDYIQVERDNPTFYDIYENTMDSNIEEAFYSSSKTPLNIQVGKIDYSQQIFENVKLETGAKLSASSFRNNVEVGNFEGELLVKDSSYSVLYNMNEEIYAGYISTDWQLNKLWLLKSGLRYEFYSMFLGSDNQPTIRDLNQGNWFPSMFLNFKPTKYQEWTGSYSRRIQRPGFMQLAPYFYFFNKSSLTTGNPNLISSISSQIKLDYRIHNLNMSLSYTYTNNPTYGIQPVLDHERELGIFMPRQGIDQKTFSFSSSVPWDITDRWTSNYQFNAHFHNQVPIVEGQPIVNKYFNYTLSMNHSFDLGKEWFLELDANYNSLQYIGMTSFEAQIGLNLGVQKKFNNGATVSMNASDLLDSISLWDLTSNIPEQNIYYNFNYKGEGRIVRLNISIPIGNKEMKMKDQRKYGSSEEQSRL